MRALLFALAIAGLGAACRKPTVTVDAGASLEIQVAPPPATLPTNLKPSVPMPADWPADVPIYPGAHVSKAEKKAKGDAGFVRTLDFETADDVKLVVEFYKTAFARATKVFDMDVAMVHGLKYEKLDVAIDISVMSAMGLTQTTLSVSSR